MAASLVLAGFLGVTGLALDKAFRVSAEASIRERLQSHIYGLLAAVDEDSAGRMIFPQELPEPRFSKPDSGLYAMAGAGGPGADWHSHSLTGRSLDILEPQLPGESVFRRVGQSGMELYVVNFGVAWEDYSGQEALYTFTVAEDAAAFEAEVQGFRATLWGWLGGLALVLLLAQGLILRWGLHPLRAVAADLRQIEKGKAERLDGDYPKELDGLTSNLNSLIENSKAVQIRYRNSLDDLAHSLKTPLAILQSLFDRETGTGHQDNGPGREQVERMDEIIRHQLQRAAVSGRATLAGPVAVSPIVERLVRSLKKVYRDKPIAIGTELDQDAAFYGDESDLMEVLGNLLDNACKYCNSEVLISAHGNHQDSGNGLEIVIEDDGIGIAPEMKNTVLQRGRRMDENVPGQGIGLSMAHEIITVYGGKLRITASPLGGAMLRISFAGV